MYHKPSRTTDSLNITLFCVAAFFSSALAGIFGIFIILGLACGVIGILIPELLHGRPLQRLHQKLWVMANFLFLMAIFASISALSQITTAILCAVAYRFVFYKKN